MPADARGIRTNPLQEIFWTRTSLLLAVLIVVSGTCLFLAGGMDPGNGKNFVQAIGTGTMISAVVGFGQTLITAAASQRALVAPVIEESKKALHELSAEYRSLNSEFFPTHVFEATSEPDPKFNELMMADLARSRQYLFRGFAGRHAAARLLHSHAEWEMRAVLADPREATTISGRARYLLRKEGAEADYDDIQQRLHDEVRVGLVGLYHARSRCTRIDLTVVDDPPLDRLEIFDDSVWITLYSDARSATTLYPRTLRFSEGSFIYNMQRAELLRTCVSRAARHFQITPETTRQDFLGLFTKITGEPLSEEQFHELEGKFRAFRKEFSTAAELGS
ncbi:hypothetical protein [Amycolatopsis suaedae]|uniref:Uncharacterized protein n=1 Tax=Amycolatopsis suaedae TaxID=2510978 RepID=A0A4V2EKX2_9PSEU|nr:hypothetical protein [Amycolatopsis suaedae]RZQ59555.1 hypothetical protein EWH70_33765 [Amycolatopsis suaedae]